MEDVAAVERFMRSFVGRDLETQVPDSRSGWAERRWLPEVEVDTSETDIEVGRTNAS